MDKYLGPKIRTIAELIGAGKTVREISSELSMTAERIAGIIYIIGNDLKIQKTSSGTRIESIIELLVAVHNAEQESGGGT